MPYLWRARLTNIEYDASKKIYSDELLRFNGQNTLINLANGGGKTLLIQLLLQVVLPNESLNKRPLADLLAGKNIPDIFWWSGSWIRRDQPFSPRVFVLHAAMTKMSV